MLLIYPVVQVEQLVDIVLQPWQLASQLLHLFKNTSAKVFVGQELEETHVFVAVDKKVELEQEVQVYEFDAQLKHEIEQAWHLFDESEKYPFGHIDKQVLLAEK